MATKNSSNISMTMGKVSEFNRYEDNWNTYIEQSEFFLKQIEFQMNRRGK